jgi:CMP-N-acetylneuraminic acid synthetase
MNSDKMITALVPMRHHSQRVVGKNYRQLAGRPLYEYIIQTLLNCPEFETIVVDTDSQPVMNGLHKKFPQVHILERPEHLRRDDVPMNEILAYDISRVKSDLYLQTHSTNPLLRSQTISRAIDTLLQNYPGRDSLFSVTRMKSRLWDQLGRPINHNPKILLQTQDLPPVYEENSCIYIFDAECLLSHRNRLGERPMMFEIDKAEAWDIDDEIDFEITEFLLQHQAKMED